MNRQKSLEHEIPCGRPIPVVRARILYPVYRALNREGFDTEAVLREFDLTFDLLADPSTFLNNNIVYRLFERGGQLSGRTDFCAIVGERVGFSEISPFGQVLNQAATLGDYIALVTQISSRSTTGTKQSLLVEAEWAYITAKRLFVPEVKPAQADAFIVSTWIALLHRVLDARWDPKGVIARLCDPSALSGRFHGINAIKGSDTGFSIRFPVTWLTSKTPGEQGATAVTTNPVSPDLLAPSGFMQTVERALLPHLGDPELSAEKAARICGFTKSALARRLARQNTTIAKTTAKLKTAEARKMLLGTRNSIADIAADLGYSDPTAFTRAFRSWFGTSPSMYRKQNLETER